MIGICSSFWCSSRRMWKRFFFIYVFYCNEVLIIGFFEVEYLDNVFVLELDGNFCFIEEYFYELFVFVVLWMQSFDY